jgi:hypothetical protein
MSDSFKIRGEHDFTTIMNNGRIRKGLKPYIPKLPKKPYKSCKGCVMLQYLISCTGYKDGGVKQRFGNSTMFYNGRCDIGYSVIDDNALIPIPKEPCPKPKTRFEYLICQHEKMRDRI